MYATWLTRSKQGHHLTGLSACCGFLGFVGESTDKHGEKWKVLGMCEVNERKFPFWSGDLIFWEILCDFISVPFTCCSLCFLPFSSTPPYLGPWENQLKHLFLRDAFSDKPKWT